MNDNGSHLILSQAEVDFSAELVRRREDADLSQKSLAALIGFARPYVSRAERPGGLISRDAVSAIDVALEAGGALVELHAEAVKERRGRRRQLADSTAGDHMQGAPYPASKRPVSALTIETVARSFRDADRSVGAGSLYGALLNYLTVEVAPSLIRTSDSTDSVFSAAAMMTDLAGWMAHDNGSDQRAREHLDSALRLAVASRDDAVALHVYGSLGHLSVECGRMDVANAVIGQGLHHASRAGGACRQQARLHALNARALAAQGRAGEFSVELDKARTMLFSTPRTSADPANTYSFDEISLASEEARCWLSLGHPRRADAAARSVLARGDSKRVRSRTLARLTLAFALARTGEAGEAAQLGLQVCESRKSLTSARVDSHLARLGTILTPQRKTKSVARFLQVLASDRLALNDGPK